MAKVTGGEIRIFSYSVNNNIVWEIEANTHVMNYSTKQLVVNEGLTSEYTVDFDKLLAIFTTDRLNVIFDNTDAVATVQEAESEPESTN